jgi:hypothetical protein
MPSRPARKLMPRKMVAKKPPIMISTVCAWRASGALNAGTPLETASVPVRATEPEENARRRSSRPSAAVPCASRQAVGASYAGIVPVA